MINKFIDTSDMNYLIIFFLEFDGHKRLINK